jgi:hypothetical protein
MHAHNVQFIYFNFLIFFYYYFFIMIVEASLVISLSVDQ